MLPNRLPVKFPEKHEHECKLAQEIAATTHEPKSAAQSSADASGDSQTGASKRTARSTAKTRTHKGPPCPIPASKRTQTRGHSGRTSVSTPDPAQRRKFRPHRPNSVPLLSQFASAEKVFVRAASESPRTPRSDKHTSAPPALPYKRPTDQKHMAAPTGPTA